MEMTAISAADEDRTKIESWSLLAYAELHVRTLFFSPRFLPVVVAKRHRHARAPALLCRGISVTPWAEEGLVARPRLEERVTP